MTRSKSAVLGDASIDHFLRKHWQKEPLVIRGAFPDFRDPLTADELAGLACEPDVDSRLVLERGGRKAWQVVRGPQNPKVLRNLGRSHWTLLVESMDRHSPPIAALASAFSFIPNWRLDDVMVSLAPVQGTVDAHIDSYDVFLIQGQGRRRWEVDRRAPAEYKPGLDLRVLKRFRAENSWILDRGDMLYVPPGVGHRGVTVPSDAEIALTYSVGFRAPSGSDLLSTLLARALAKETPKLLSDAGRKETHDPGEISAADLASLRRFLIRDIPPQNGDDWALAMGEALTSGGEGRRSAPRATQPLVARRLAAGGTVSAVPGARMAWTALNRGRAALFVNGESRVLPRGQAFAASFLCGNRIPSAARRLAGQPNLLALIVDLFRAGVVAWRD